MTPRKANPLHPEHMGWVQGLLLAEPPYNAGLTGEVVCEREPLAGTSGAPVTDMDHGAQYIAVAFAVTGTTRASR